MAQFLSLRNIYFLFVLFTITACVSTKKFEAQAKQLQQTNQKLEQVEAEQKAIQTKLSASQDSLKDLKLELQQNQIRSEYNVYKTARAAGDYQSASISLLRLVEADTTQSYWV